MTATPTICLNMIVRDEAEIIRETLIDICEAVKFHSWVIHDTGSSDATAEIIAAVSTRSAS